MTEFRDPLTMVLNGQPAPFVPVAPSYENLGPLEFRRMELKWRGWDARLRMAGADRLPVEYQAYFDVELETHREILDTCYPPPAWLGLPLVATPEEIAGCVVARSGEDLCWISPSGRETWLPPDRVTYHARLAAEKTHHYAHLWEQGFDPDAIDALGLAPEAPTTVSGPTREEVEAELASGRYELARRLRERYHGSPPCYVYAPSPYGGLLGQLGFQGMMYALAQRRDVVHRVLQHGLPQPSLRFAAAKAFGVGIAFVEECLASADLISPQMYLEFAHAYTKPHLQFLEDRGFRTVLYFSGNLMPLLPYLNELPFTALAFEENRKNYGIDLAEVRRALPGTVLFGNVDAAWLERATNGEVMAEVRRQIAIAGRDGKYVLSVGSPFTPGTSLERVRFFCESTQQL